MYQNDGGTQTVARVYFSRGYRQPLTGSWWVRLLTRSEIAHVSIGDGSVVLDPSDAGDRFIDEDRFVLCYPRLVAAVELLTPIPLGLHAHRPSPRRWLVWHLLRWMTRGRVRANDCMEVVVGHLAGAGVSIPRAVATPQALLNHLTRIGGRRVDFC